MAHNPNSMRDYSNTKIDNLIGKLENHIGNHRYDRDISNFVHCLAQLKAERASRIGKKSRLRVRG